MTRHRYRLKLTAMAAALATAAILSSCGSSTSHTTMSPGGNGHATQMSGAMPHDSTMNTSNMDDMGHMGSMDSSGSMHGTPMAAGDGLATTSDGYRLALTRPAPATGSVSTLSFTIQESGGHTLTRFAEDQTERLHFYAIRSDLTGFQHVHPTLAPDGTWTAHLAPLVPGTWRVYASFIADEGPGRGNAYVLSDALTIRGTARIIAPPLTEDLATTVDGYTITVSGRPTAGSTSAISVRFEHDGKPVTDLQPYLDTYAHLSAFHAGDLAFAHLHPQGTVNGDHGGPTLDFEADLPRSGPWRIYIQFRTGNVLHTAAVTVHAR